MKEITLPIAPVRFSERLLFTKHLAIMIKSGIPLSTAIHSLADHASSRTFKSVLEAVAIDLENGKSLTDAFAAHPRVFNEFYRSMVGVAEESGTLEESLAFLAEQMGKEYSLRKKVQGAMMYPALVFTATFIMGGFIGLYILPQLIDFFDTFEIDLPLTTRILLFIATAMRDYGVMILLGIIALTIIAAFMTRMPPIRPHWHRLLLHVPVFGRLITAAQLARFSRNLGILIRSGVPIASSFAITSDTLSNLVYRTHVGTLEKELQKGKSIADTLEQDGFDAFPPLVATMIAVGEQSGQLEESLLYLGDFYEEEIDTIAKNLSTILEPFLLITIGLVVGFVALAIISPIYELTGSIR